MKKQRIKPAVKIISGILLILLVLFAFKAFFEALSGIDYFKIKEVIVNSPYPIDVSYLKYRNIFSVNLNREAEHLESLYPGFRRVRLIRILPDKLFVDFVKRAPLAYVKLYRYFCVDTDSVLFEVSGSPQDLQLPVIAGLDTKIFGVKPGRKYNINELSLALGIIKGIKNNRSLRHCQIKNINVSDPVNASLSMSLAEGSEPVEVKIGQGVIADKINILGSLISSENRDRFNIKYIDLRFKEPVIKLKDKVK